MNVFIPLILLWTGSQSVAQINLGNGGQFGSFFTPDNDLDDYCYRQDEEPYIYFGTKTSYDSLTRRAGQQHIVPGCQPVQFWSINRHGTRLPKVKKIQKLRKLQDVKDEIVKNYEDRKSYPVIGKLCFDDYNLLRRWRWNDTITEDKAAALTQQGINELKLLARRYKTKFPQLLNQPYNEQNYYFQYTQTDRTHDSYQAYIEGLFDRDFFKVHANTYGNDMLLKAYRNCKEWHEKSDKNPETSQEYRAFLESEDYQKMARQVLRRLGFRSELNVSVIQDIYDMCRFNKAWQVDQPSAWCVAFTKSQLKLLEYGEDLKEYYNTGYGNPLIQNIGCGAVQDMYRKFEKTVQGFSDGNKVTALFTHAATMQAVYSTLGIAKDYEPLKSDNYRKQQRRMWRTSLINPFAANLVAVLYQCQNGNQQGNSFKVMFFLNEIPIEEFLGCSVGLCDWATVEKNFQQVVENCNVQAFCDGESSASSQIGSALLSFFAVLMAAFRQHYW
ncbi:multiple inositol polyphosphate phosphatase 1 [Dendroctonus ponderosae]|uniref:multiple inositol polyphosphate phosphatase 1 n=1 Tax=Dendroctonus ponderosae TaxID=77166 RepID=UPI0020358639|nr:multiple inositol polyphosphate phosphatase 1 [Dendroctonus ponderosae]XP_048520027.1 multiple inositol polyphosphate phosphatase 1 [Dendroctonus ponderosae]